jgi:hypothetical protein
MSHAIRSPLRLFSLRRRFSLRSLLVLTALVALGLTAGSFANLHLTRVYTVRALDVAIDGPGYFVVSECYESGPFYYARKGRLWIDENWVVRIGMPEQMLVLDPPFRFRLTHKRSSSNVTAAFAAVSINPRFR